MDITVSGTLNIFADVTTINQIAGLIGGGMDCENMKFVVTGKLKYYENREELVEEIEDMGGSVTGSVSKNTDYLICNDKDSTSSKMRKAQELHVPVISEREFIYLFGEPVLFDFDEEDDSEEYNYAEIRGEVADDFTIDKEKGQITLPFDQSYELLRTLDSEKDIVDFVTFLIGKYSGITRAKFEGTIDSWSSGEHSKFVCEYDGQETTIKSY